MRAIRVWVLPTLAFGLLITACQGCGDSAGTGGSGGNPTGGSSAGGAGGAATGGGGSGGQAGSELTGGGGNTFMECTGTVCGDGGCCDPTNEECVSAACLPTCDSAIRCGADLATCCDVGQVCISEQCETPGAACNDWADCGEAEFCDPAVGACLPQPPGEPVCEYKPPTGPLTPVLEWAWTESTIFPTSRQVINMPVVVDLEGDGTPDVVFVTSDGFSPNGPAYLRALDGATGVEKWDANTGVYADAARVQPRATPAAADIDGDMRPEIISAKLGGGLIAFEHDGTVKWTTTQTDGVTPWTVALDSVTVAIADFEGDGSAEIVAGGAVFSSTGVLRFNSGALVGANLSTYGAVSIVADLDATPPQELVSGSRAYRANGDLYWDNGLSDGYPAIADLDLDGTPELVVISNGTGRVQSATTGAVLAQVTMPGTGVGGPPTIADFDADGIPEIASANGSAYSVYEYTGGATPALTVKWQAATQDLSSNRTGSSVFDFQGDGSAEVVYNDECYFRVYSGTDGTPLYEVANSSATIHEYPVVVDVDGDNNTEVVIVANDLNHNANTCPYGLGGARHGVFSYGDADDNWVRTRKVWNQHAYHITNINADGTLPLSESFSWLPPGLNNYRQSSQGNGVFNSPDLQVSLEASLQNCPDALKLVARVRNQGSLGVPAGVSVRFYLGTNSSGPLLGEAFTSQILLPGQYEEVELDYNVGPGDVDLGFFVEVDVDEVGASTINECLEDNNAALLSGVSCPTAG